MTEKVRVRSVKFAPLLLRPRIVGAEIPQMPLRITARVEAAPVILIGNLHGDLGPGGVRPRVMRIGIVHDHVGALGPGPAHLLRRLDPLAKFVGARRAEHNHAVAKGELGVRDGPVLAGYDKVLFESEGLAQPIDRSGRIAGMTVEIVFLAPPDMMTSSEAVNLSMGNTDQRRASFETAAFAAPSGRGLS